MMRLSFHLIVATEVLNKIKLWQATCLAEGFDLHFENELPVTDFNSMGSTLRLDYKGRKAEVKIYTSPASDVTDICDELQQYLSEKQNLAINFDFNGESNAVYGVTIAVSVLIHLLEGTLYIEGDGVIVTAAQALENARSINACA